MRFFGLMLAGLALSGCATVVRGVDNDVAFESEPAGATMTTTLGHSCTTPCTLSIPRSDSFSATFNLEGFEPRTVPVEARMSAAGGAGVAGNVIAGGFVGMAVDASTGAMNDHFPNPVFVNFSDPAMTTTPATDNTNNAPATRDTPAADPVPTS
ncbi:MAG: translation initiation factor 2 [Cohaesibacteraceae bacterium]